MIAVLDYGIGNLCSAQKALARLGAQAVLVKDPDDARGAEGVVLPGVGAFGRCMEALRDSGLDTVVYDAVDRSIPFLGVCVGFQMLYDSSQESPGTAGLGILPGTVSILAPEQKRPQMQWNVLDRVGGASAMLAGMEEKPWVYFVHSYAPVPADDSGSGVIATCDYGGTVTAAIERGNMWATQFHPEKSGRSGLAVLTNFVSLCAGNN